MKKIFCLLLFSVLVSLFVLGQPAPKTEPAGRGFPEGSTKTTYPTTTDKSLNKETIIEIKDEGGTVKVRFTFKKDVTNKWTVVVDELSPSGKTKCRATYQYDQENKLISSEMKSSDTKKKYIRNSNGELRLESDPESKDFLTGAAVEQLEETLENSTKAIEENVSQSFGYLQSPCAEPGSNCQTQFVIFAGPSVLIAGFGGGSNETLFGGHVSFNYNLSSHFFIGANGSLHSKTFGTQKLSRNFVLAEVGLRLYDSSKNCFKTVMVNFHVDAGLAGEHYGKADGSGFAFGGGGAVDFMVSKQIGVLFQADWLGIKFKNSSEVTGNWRASIGALLKF